MCFKKIVLLLFVVLGFAPVVGCRSHRGVSQQASMIFVEAEGFTTHGGWLLDQQFMDEMGSPFLLAHGVGRPVDNAVTSVEVADSGRYQLWVRTRNWAAPWQVKAAPGQFQLLVDGQSTGAVLGTEKADWHWQSGGQVDLTRGTHQLALHDLTGFNGRCDAVILSRDLNWRPPNEIAAIKAMRREQLALPDHPELAGHYDLVVIGGGVAGMTTALASARLGLKVALIQNRAVLGGHYSSEIRVSPVAAVNQAPYPALGKIVNEIEYGHSQGRNQLGVKKSVPDAKEADIYGDDHKIALMKSEKNIDLFLRMHAFSVEMDGKRIKAVIARHVQTGREQKYTGTLIADCTGDGTIGYLAGADYAMGREPNKKYGESLAPAKADNLILGSTLLWNTEVVDQPVAFPDISDWALPITDQSAYFQTEAVWSWETGWYMNPLTEGEKIRDRALRSVYSNWSFLKNHSARKARYQRVRLNWVGHVLAVRESRRLLGDVILKEQDIRKMKLFPDAAVTTTKSIDLHYPRPDNLKWFPNNAWRSKAVFTKIQPYPIPYRCFYSRNIDNLFMAGRNISVTHIALGTTRMMRTNGMMGEVVGMAASICLKYGVQPRDVYQTHLKELQAMMTQGVGK